MTRRTLLELAALGAAANVAEAAEPPFTLPKLPFAYDALEPYIDAQTMQIHHDKHHQAYVDNLNKAVAGDAELPKLTVDELLSRQRENGSAKPGWRARQSLVVLANVMSRLPKPEAGRRLCLGSHSNFWRAGQVRRPAPRCRQQRFRKRLGLVVARFFGKIKARHGTESGQPAALQAASFAGDRRLGTRLLPQISEPESRLPGCHRPRH